MNGFSIINRSLSWYFGGFSFFSFLYLFGFHSGNSWNRVGFFKSSQSNKLIFKILMFFVFRIFIIKNFKCFFKYYVVSKIKPGCSGLGGGSYDLNLASLLNYFSRSYSSGVKSNSSYTGLSFLAPFLLLLLDFFDPLTFFSYP